MVLAVPIMGCNLSTVQNCLNTMYSRHATTEEKKTMHSKFAQAGRAHELPRIEKDWKYLPSFSPS